MAGLVSSVSYSLSILSSMIMIARRRSDTAVIHNTYIPTHLYINNTARMRVAVSPEVLTMALAIVQC